MWNIVVGLAMWVLLSALVGVAEWALEVLHGTRTVDAFFIALNGAMILAFLLSVAWVVGYFTVYVMGVRI